MPVRRYVIGFLCHNYNVALITKNRPDYQKGKLNGIGGHIEKGETPAQAMEREFNEEAGIRVLNWQLLCEASVIEPRAKLYIYHAHIGEHVHIQQLTDEYVAWYFAHNLPDNVMPILRWLIPMAMSKTPIVAKIKMIREDK
jgi:8-oxo-dGTP diphosphatase